VDPPKPFLESILADFEAAMAGTGAPLALPLQRQPGSSTAFWERVMAFVVTEPCFGCKYTDCVVVCPSDCFHEGDQMLFIDPDECIDCDACAGECPVQAIYHEDNVPEQWKDFVALNREMSAVCPTICDRKEPLARRDTPS
jgi:ferredoxin